MIHLTLGNKQFSLESETPVSHLLQEIENKQKIYAVVHNGKLHDLNWIIKESGNLELIDNESEIGHQIYDRSLTFLFISAVHRCFPNAAVSIQHALSNGLFCEVQLKEKQLTEKECHMIEDTMKKMVKEKLPIHRSVVLTQQAVDFFNQIGHPEKAELLSIRKSETSSIYHLNGVDDYFYGIMLPNTSYLDHFWIRLYEQGIWISAQNQFVDQHQMFQVFQEFEAWGNLIGVTHIAQLNKKINEGKMDELVLMSETKMEKKLGMLADEIFHQKPDTRIILISGPSSAGKTTFSKRLAIHLNILGKEPIAISMDDFYVNRLDTPLLEDGSYDFESPRALDLKLFNDTIVKLLNHEPTKMPYYNFKTGKREWREGLFTLKENQILIIEGIHGLNPEISKAIPENVKYKIYINALTHLNLDEHNRIPTSDYRLIRRIVRDRQFRGYSAQQTIQFWKNVRDGEDRYIYPYQEEADAIFNSSMVYELAVLKKIAAPELESVPKDSKEFLEANRLKKLLEYFVEKDSEAIPRNSILAEFIGNSVFDVT